MFKLSLFISVSLLSLNLDQAYAKGTRTQLNTAEEWKGYCTQKIQKHEKEQGKKEFYLLLKM